jgi:hypothetical protein
LVLFGSSKQRNRIVGAFREKENAKKLNTASNIPIIQYWFAFTFCFHFKIEPLKL